MTGADWLLLVAIGALFLISGVLAMAETAFTRMSRVRALALEEEGRSGATRLARLLERPERTLNSLLLVILVCQLVSANLTGVLLEQHFGTLGFVLGIVVEIAVFFVFFEVVPKTFAIQHTDRAVLLVSPVLSFLTNFPPLRATMACSFEMTLSRIWMELSGCRPIDVESPSGNSALLPSGWISRRRAILVHRR